MDCICSGRPGTVQQYRPRSPASVVPQGNATNYTPVVSAADEHTEPVNRGVIHSKFNFVAISFYVYVYRYMHECRAQKRVRH